MIVFVDASALVAIISEETGYEKLAGLIARADKALWSAISRWETVRAVTRIKRQSVLEAEHITDRYAGTFLTLVSIGAEEARLAIEAHHRYGKGNHDARLNIGDCFAYACAKAHGAKLLYKGDDFALTDLA